MPRIDSIWLENRHWLHLHQLHLQAQNTDIAVLYNRIDIVLVCIRIWLDFSRTTPHTKAKGNNEECCCIVCDVGSPARGWEMQQYHGERGKGGRTLLWYAKLLFSYWLSTCIIYGDVYHLHKLNCLWYDILITSMFDEWSCIVCDIGKCCVYCWECLFEWWDGDSAYRFILSYLGHDAENPLLLLANSHTLPYRWISVSWLHSIHNGDIEGHFQDNSSSRHEFQVMICCCRVEFIRYLLTNLWCKCPVCFSRFSNKCRWVVVPILCSLDYKCSWYNLWEWYHDTDRF